MAQKWPGWVGRANGQAWDNAMGVNITREWKMGSTRYLHRRRLIKVDRNMSWQHESGIWLRGGANVAVHGGAKVAEGVCIPYGTNLAGIWTRSGMARIWPNWVGLWQADSCNKTM